MIVIEEAKRKICNSPRLPCNSCKFVYREQKESSGPIVFYCTLHDNKPKETKPKKPRGRKGGRKKKEEKVMEKKEEGLLVSVPSTLTTEVKREKKIMPMPTNVTSVKEENED